MYSCRQECTQIPMYVVSDMNVLHHVYLDMNVLRLYECTQTFRCIDITLDLYCSLDV